MGERAAYPSDLTDEQWAVVGPFLQVWKDRHPSVSGHQGRYQLREIVNAIFYQDRSFGVGWPTGGFTRGGIRIAWQPRPPTLRRSNARGCS